MSIASVTWALGLNLDDSPMTKLVLIALISIQYGNLDDAVCQIMTMLRLSERATRDHIRKLELHGYVHSRPVVVAG